jgi:DNA-binding MarR family transcriptional regulator
MGTVADVDRKEAVRDLLKSLSELKGWFRETAAQPDGTTAAHATLALLEGRSPTRVSELADAARLDLSVVSRQVHQLESAALVDRRPDPTDRRASLVGITDAGRAVLAERRQCLGSLVSDRLVGWAPEDLTAIAHGLRRLVDDLSA